MIVGPETKDLLEVNLQEVQELLTPLTCELQVLLEDEAPLTQSPRPPKVLEESTSPVSAVPGRPRIVQHTP
jgi:hypothetical protein